MTSTTSITPLTTTRRGRDSGTLARIRRPLHVAGFGRVRVTVDLVGHACQLPRQLNQRANSRPCQFAQLRYCEEGEDRFLSGSGTRALCTLNDLQLGIVHIMARRTSAALRALHARPQRTSTGAASGEVCVSYAAAALRLPPLEYVYKNARMHALYPDVMTYVMIPSSLAELDLHKQILFIAQRGGRECRRTRYPAWHARPRVLSTPAGCPARCECVPGCRPGPSCSGVA